MSMYIEEGYRNRDDYLEQLAEEFDIELETVRMVADMLGSQEDYDGLVSTLEDMSLEVCD